MKKTSGFLLIPCWIIFVFSPLSNAHCQQDSTHRAIASTKIRAGYNFGGLAFKDHYISPEKYNGTISQYNLCWARKHEKYLYRLKFAYGYSDEIKNNNARTEITQVFMNQGFLYPLKVKPIFNKPWFLFMGPSTDLLYFFNDPVLSVSGFDYTQSHTTMFSLGLTSLAIYDFTKKLSLESGLHISILSFANRSVDSEEDNESPAKILTLIQGLEGSFMARLTWQPWKHVNIDAGYEFQLLNVSAWEPVTVASDLISVGFAWKF